jgi:hypothetical protein
MEYNHVEKYPLNHQNVSFYTGSFGGDQGVQICLESEVDYGIAFNRWFYGLDGCRGDHVDRFCGPGNRFELRDRTPRIEVIILEGEHFYVQTYGARNEAA